MQTRSENKPSVELSAAGTAPPPVQLSAKPDPDATLDKLKELEQRLNEMIGLYVQDQAKNKFINERLKHDADLVKNASLDQLNDAKSQIKLADSVGLKERQQKTADKIKEQLVGVDNEKAKEINELLARIHEVRLSILNNAISKQNDDEYAIAYDLFNNYMGRKPPEVTARPAGTPAPKKNLREELGIPGRVDHQNKTFSVEFSGNEARSSDPTGLGYGMVAAGYKDIEFTGSPEKALEAMRAALKAGAENVDLDEKTKKYLEDPNNGFYTGYDHWRAVNKEYRDIRKLVEAKKEVAAHTQNRVFSQETPKVKMHLDIFERLNNDEQRRAFLVSLPIEDLVDLTFEIERLNRAKGIETPFIWGETKVDEYDYFSHLLKTEGPNGWIELAFKQKYGEAQLKKIEDFKKLKNPVEAAEFIMRIKDPKIRNKFYEQIDNMLFAGSKDSSSQEFTNQVRAALLGALVDRRYKASKADPKEHSRILKVNKIPDRNEVREILGGPSQEDFKEIVGLYCGSFERVATKIKGYNAEKGTQVTREMIDQILENDEPLDPSLIQKPEGSNNQRDLITSKSDMYRYRAFAKNIDLVINHFIEHPNELPKPKPGSRTEEFIKMSPGTGVSLPSLASGGGRGPSR